MGESWDRGTRSIARNLFLICVVVLALAGIYPFVAGSTSSLEENLVGTLALAAGVTILFLASMVLWKAKSERISAVLGAIASAGALVSTLFNIWFQAQLNAPASGLGTIAIAAAPISWLLAFTFLVIGILGLANLRGGALWVRRITIYCILALAAMITYGILGGPSYPFSEEYLLRGGMVLTMAVATGGISVAVMHRRYVEPGWGQTPPLEFRMRITCPGCGNTLDVKPGRSTCRTCRLHFQIEVHPATCSHCGYLLYRLTNDRCPECGVPIKDDDQAA